ncbi:MAG: hypothetical protein CL561_07825 [Alphaproteobacteria bacterium]|nr:hypothetical protein [Alphaproteobacteria bacterium]|tara:strand:- start:456761 stop:457354 length:594 start_codon:yes stop_codon:yes gene_type:complete
MRSTSFIRRSLLTVTAAVCLSGCTGAVALLGSMPNYEDGGNIVILNQTAADVIAQQLKARSRHTLPIIVQDFWDNHAPQRMSALGRVLPEQISTRLIQLGHQVIQPRYIQNNAMSLDSSASPESLLANQQMNPQRFKELTDGPHLILSGSFTKAVNNVKVHARITDSTSGIFVAAYDYEMPITREIEEMIYPPKVKQ